MNVKNTILCLSQKNRQSDGALPHHKPTTNDPETTNEFKCVMGLDSPVWLLLMLYRVFSQPCRLHKQFNPVTEGPPLPRFATDEPWACHQVWAQLSFDKWIKTISLGRDHLTVQKPVSLSSLAQGGWHSQPPLQLGVAMQLNSGQWKVSCKYGPPSGWVYQTDT